MGQFHVLCDRSDSGVVALFLQGENKVMTQSELNRQIAKQTGESVAEIARHGFTILKELSQDDDGCRCRPMRLPRQLLQPEASD